MGFKGVCRIVRVGEKELCRDDYVVVGVVIIE